MNAPRLADLVTQLRGRVTDPARQAIVEALLVDVAQLQARSLAGEDVQREMAHVQSQSLSLTATEAAFIRHAVIGWVTDILHVAIAVA